MSRYSTTPKPIFKRESLTYYVLNPIPIHGWAVPYKAYDSATSSLIASAETLDELRERCTFLGYKQEDIA